MSHRIIDQRSLAYNRLIVQKIRQRPELMNFVRNELDRTLAEPRLSFRKLGNWAFAVHVNF